MKDGSTGSVDCPSLDNEELPHNALAELRPRVKQLAHLRINLDHLQRGGFLFRLLDFCFGEIIHLTSAALIVLFYAFYLIIRAIQPHI